MTLESANRTPRPKVVKCVTSSVALPWIILLACAAPAHCDPMRSVDLGFLAFHAGPDRAIHQWITGGLLEYDPETPERLDRLRAATASLGRYEGHEHVQVVDVGGGSVLIYSSARFQRGTLFFRFTVFQDLLRSRINAIAWSDDPAETFPEGVVAGLRKPRCD